MDYWSILLAVIAVVIGLYFYGTKNHDYFKKRRIPFAPAVPILGSNWKAFIKLQNVADMVKDVYDVNPQAKYVGFFDLMTPTIMIRDLDLIKNITVKNFDHFPDHQGFLDDSVDPLFGKNLFALRGDKWKDVRSLLSPAFTSSKMKAMFTLMTECAKTYGEYLVKLPVDKRTMEMKDTCTRYTNDVIATCAFGIRVDSMTDRNNKFYVYGRDATNFGILATLKFLLLKSFPILGKLGLSFVRPEIANFFKDVVATTIRSRDEKGITRPDMIQLMMEARGTGKELSIDDMTSQAFGFFFGGFESTSTMMCFSLYLLTVHPEMQERLQNEIDQVLEDGNGEFTYEAVNSMKYLDAVVNEALRLYPVQIAVDRVCMKKFELPPALPGLEPLVVEKGACVWLPVYGFQRDPQYFEEPDKFNPDRFLDDGKKIVNSGAYIPFGMGPRMCIGNRFALLETKVLLCNILARCDLKVCSKTPIPMVLSKSGFSTTSDKGFWLDIQPRSNAHPTVAIQVANGVPMSNGKVNDCSAL